LTLDGNGHPKLTIGSRITHPLHGSGTVIFVGADYLGIAFDDGGEVLIRRETLEEKASTIAEAPEACRETLPWPT